MKPSEALRQAMYELADTFCNELANEWDEIQEAIDLACNKYPELKDNIFADYMSED